MPRHGWMSACAAEKLTLGPPVLSNSRQAIRTCGPEAQAIRPKQPSSAPTPPKQFRLSNSGCGSRTRAIRLSNAGCARGVRLLISMVHLYSQKGNKSESRASVTRHRGSIASRACAMLVTCSACRAPWLMCDGSDGPLLRPSGSVAPCMPTARRGRSHSTAHVAQALTGVRVLKLCRRHAQVSLPLRAAELPRLSLLGQLQPRGVACACQTLVAMLP